MPAISPIPPPLTPQQMETVMQQTTLAMLGLAQDRGDLVRIGWQIEGQPTGTPSDDIVYVRAVEDDDAYNRQRDVENNQLDDVTLQQLTTYVRVWRVMWTLYGPNGFDRARRLRSALFTQVTGDTFAVLNVGLYPVLDPASPVRAPEYFQGRWWERADFECQFNELVTEETVTAAVASSEVRIYIKDSPDIDSPARDIIVSVPTP